MLIKNIYNISNTDLQYWQHIRCWLTIFATFGILNNKFGNISIGIFKALNWFPNSNDFESGKSVHGRSCAFFKSISVCKEIENKPSLPLLLFQWNSVRFFPTFTWYLFCTFFNLNGLKFVKSCRQLGFLNICVFAILIVIVATFCRRNIFLPDQCNATCNLLWHGF